MSFDQCSTVAQDCNLALPDAIQQKKTRLWDVQTKPNQ